MLKSGPSVIGAQSSSCTKGTGPLGCFAFNSSQVVSLFGAILLLLLFYLIIFLRYYYYYKYIQP